MKISYTIEETYYGCERYLWTVSLESDDGRYFHIGGTTWPITSEQDANDIGDRLVEALERVQ